MDSSESKQPPDISSTSSEPEDTQTSITITYRGAPHTFTLPSAGTLTDLASAIESQLSTPIATQKLLIPGLGLQKPPFTSSPPLSSLSASKRIQLLAPTPSELTSLAEGHTLAAKSSRPRTIPTATPSRSRPSIATLSDSISYTFHRIVPLPYLPNPERATRFLERLRDDPGIKAAMAAHKFSVGTLTEMDPAVHTTHESRTLGLNRNAGEIIELRLRTDAFDGYRDYKTIRKTLCHELAHNVHGPHDRNFWDLCGKIEREVDKADWRSGGHRVGEEEFYNPDDGGVGEIDGGGWTGGSYVLGGVTDTSAARSGDAVQDRRAALSKAAEERLRRQREQNEERGGGGS